MQNRIIDIGKVKSQEVISQDITLESDNIGNVHTSCGCTSTAIKGNTITANLKPPRVKREKDWSVSITVTYKDSTKDVIFIKGIVVP